MVAANFAAVAARLGVETRVTFLADGTPEPDFDEEQVSCTCTNVSFVFGDSLDAGPGTLFVTTRYDLPASQPAFQQHLLQVHNSSFLFPGLCPPCLQF